MSTGTPTSRPIAHLVFVYPAEVDPSEQAVSGGDLPRSVQGGEECALHHTQPLIVPLWYKTCPEKLSDPVPCMGFPENQDL